jgi:hypothetical protein
LCWRRWLEVRDGDPSRDGDDVLDGNVVLDLDCFDRIYLNGYVPNLQVGVLAIRLPGKPQVNSGEQVKRALFNPRVPGSIPGRPTCDARPDLHVRLRSRLLECLQWTTVCSLWCSVVETGQV